ncbi:sulfite reductase subunit alpha [Undibacterium sp. Ji49W]|uniref:sulfite reductase subunit alpha n=1 Tax=Undibacterium sp. Ji49W TaxID=3413040 RepID=UPI003BF26E0E
MRLPSLRLTGLLCLAFTLLFILSFFWHGAVQRDLSAGLLLVGYLSFCVWTGLRHKDSQSRSMQGFPAELQRHDQESILITYASQTGYAEQIAIKTAMHLQKAGMDIAVCALGAIQPAQLQKAQRMLFVVSTTGEGDAPDNAAAFTRRLMNQTLDLSHLSFSVLALGDRHYQQFCAFGHRLAHWLRQQQAQCLFDLIEVDNGDEGALRHWQHYLGVISGHTEMSDWSKPGYQDWILTERELLNPGSMGGPAYRIACRPADGELKWAAGDIAEIEPQHPPATSANTANTANTQGEDLTTPLPHREYSISSIPADGKLELLVRQMRRPDGSLGIGSGWLTEYAQVGQTLGLRLRENRNFHTPAQDIPLILIGNGTGLAGLRAHIKARAARHQLRNWLFFGERQQAHDYFHRDEIQAWQQTGVLSRLDLCFSRDQEERRYVQHAMLEQASEILSWVDQGAAILVCGSLQGMAEEVHATLSIILGAGRLEELTEQHLYRRDVY